jgi:hypothetical protein
MNILKSFAALAVITCSFMAVPQLAYAQNFNGAKEEACNGATLKATGAQCTTKGGTEGAKAVTKIEETIQNVINLLTIIIGIVAVILIIINGLRFITANGDSNSITSARNGVIYAIVGLIIVALAQLIVRFVISRT